MKKIIIYAMISLILIGCAEASPYAAKYVTSDCYGFWGGLWHGMIVPFSWIGSLIDSEIAIYAYDNNGGWYVFGFVLGNGALTAGIGRTSKD
jgi:hypothetical protein